MSGANIADNVTFPANSVDLVTTVADTQMGVTIQLGGVTSWGEYLEEQYEDGLWTGWDEEYKRDFESKHDGYLMLWGFDTSAVLNPQDGAIDAGCLHSPSGEGGYCAGIKYVGTQTPSPQLWAQWSTHQ